MQFTSFTFLLFAAVLLIAYYLAPKRGQWILLLTASYIFYLCAGMEYLAFILFTTATTYAATYIIAHNQEEADSILRDKYGTPVTWEQIPFSQGDKWGYTSHELEPGMAKVPAKVIRAYFKKKNKVWLILCLVVNFSVLAMCKALLIEPFSAMVQEGSFSFLTAALPMGISFYMFQSMGYVIDVYRGKCRAEKNIFKLALFVSFFPQLIQGPISKFSQLAHQLYAPHEYDGKQVSVGLQRMLWGYFKKLVIADRITVAVAALKGPEYIGVSFLVLTVFYAVQIYADFTGGIDVAIGLSQALGITLPENFIRPYFSKNIAEYWRRWHITLGEWMKDYIFYPISISKPMLNLSKQARAKFGNFGKRLPVYAASVATWFVTGIWHGLTPNFILWGMMNCFVIVVSEELAPLYTRFHDRFHLKEKKWYGGFEIIRMFLLMNLIRIVDLFPNVGDYFSRVGSLFTAWNLHILWDGTLLALGLTKLDYIILVAGVVLLFIISLIQEKKGSVREILWNKPIFLRYTLLFALLVIVLLMGSYGIGYNASNFIYNQF